jgi:hyperosmotically inducible protein
MGEDKKLASKLQSLIDQDQNLGSYGLDADVVEEIGKISGVVESLAEKQHLDTLVSKIGLKGWENYVSISTDGSFRDKDLELEVAQELTDFPEQLGVTVKGGIAYLEGRVSSKEEEEKALAKAARARGIVGVKSQLKVGVDPEMSLEEIFHSQVRNDGD